MAAVSLVAAVLLSAGTSVLRWEVRHGALPVPPLETAVELAWDETGGFGPLASPDPVQDHGRDRMLETRIALAQTVGMFRLAANATLATNLRSGIETDYGYALTATAPVFAVLVGLEAFGGLGDTHAFVETPSHAHFVGALIAGSLTADWTLRMQTARALSPVSETVVRVQISSAF